MFKEMTHDEMMKVDGGSFIIDGILLEETGKNGAEWVQLGYSAFKKALKDHEDKDGLVELVRGYLNW